ncbi:MAG: hypothetical protein H0W15_01665 [Gemmatimonadales bacterium]|nr:hypothetical protein [Gemmatimonadales bacterium]
MTTWRVLHFIGLVAWLGGGMAVMVSGVVMRSLDRAFWGAIADVQAMLYRTLIGPGSVVTVMSGLFLTFGLYGRLSGEVAAWLGVMQGFGLIAALVTLLGAMPAAARLSRLEPLGTTGAAFDAARRRLAAMGAVAGVFGAIALVAGALYRGG